MRPDHTTRKARRELQMVRCKRKVGTVTQNPRGQKTKLIVKILNSLRDRRRTQNQPVPGAFRHPDQTPAPLCPHPLDEMGLVNNHESTFIYQIERTRNLLQIPGHALDAEEIPADRKRTRTSAHLLPDMFQQCLRTKPDHPRNPTPATRYQLHRRANPPGSLLHEKGADPARHQLLHRGQLVIHQLGFSHHRGDSHRFQPVPAEAAAPEPGNEAFC